MEIRRVGDPVLREKCIDVEEIDAGIKRLVKEMEETMFASGGRGLAASQVGVMKRLFIYDGGHGVRCIINPEIIETEGEEEGEEGCLSIPGVVVKVNRAKKIKVRCKTLSGYTILIEPGGFLSRVFQHECDHLDGILIIDRCSVEERRRAFNLLEKMEMAKRGLNS